MKNRPLLIGLGLLWAWLLPGCQRPTEEEPIRPVRAIRAGDVTSFVTGSFPGRAQATQSVELSFRVAGPLLTRPASMGDKVSRDDVLAEIDPREFQLTVQNVEGQLEQAKARRDFTESDFKRAEKMRAEDPGAISGSLFDQKRNDRDDARAQVKSLTASLDSANDALGYTQLKAPFDGTVVATYVENFEDVRSKQPIVRLLDTSRIEMVINLPERAMPGLQHIDRIELWCVFDQYKDLELPAKVKEVGTEASSSTRTYPVTLIMDQPEGVEVFPGMAGTAYARGTLPEEMSKGGIEVPMGAIFSPDTEKQDYVWVIDESTGKVERRRVTTGRRTTAGVLVEEGLQSGEWIATAGVFSLREGQQVKIQTKILGQKGS